MFSKSLSLRPKTKKAKQNEQAIYQPVFSSNNRLISSNRNLNMISEETENEMEVKKKEVINDDFVVIEK